MSSIAAAHVHPRPKRRHERIATRVAARLVCGGGEDAARVLNVGVGGACIGTASPPPIGSQVTLTFRMVTRRVARATGNVVWRRDGDGAGFGVAFDDTNAPMTSFLSSLTKLPPDLRILYLADVTNPKIDVSS